MQYKSIYHNATQYDDIHWWKKDDMEFWTRIIEEKKPQSVLELASGTGRLAKIFLREGIYYSGLEIVPDFITACKTKLIHYTDYLSITEGDMRNFKLKGKYDLIFIGFNSFLHLLTDQDVMDCFNSVKHHMHAKSHFIIDIFIPNPLFLYKPINYRNKVLEFMNSTTNDRTFVEEINTYDTNTEVNEIIWYFSTAKKKDYEKRIFSMRMFFPSKMNHMLIDAGFKICNQWGDYSQTKLNENSKLQIYDLILNTI